MIEGDGVCNVSVRLNPTPSGVGFQVSGVWFRVQDLEFVVWDAGNLLAVHGAERVGNVEEVAVARLCHLRHGKAGSAHCVKISSHLSLVPVQ